MRILVLDNAVATTGAFLSAMAMVERLDREFTWQFALPQDSSVHDMVRANGLQSVDLPMVEIGRSWSRLLAYLPMLVVNGLRLRRILARNRIDVLVANDYFNLLPFVVRVTGWRGRIVTIVRLLPKSQIPVLNAVWLKAAGFAADSIIAVSRAVMTQLPSWLRAELIYFPVGRGIDGADYAAAQGSGGCRFLYLANYIRGKGQDEALEAFAQVLRLVPTASLRFVGGDMGLEKNRSYRNELESRARLLGVASAIAFAGPVQHVQEEIRSADVILNFSKSESFSHTCAEAGFLGRPVVATRCGGPEEIVLDGETGLLVPIDDTDAMARAMLELARDPERRLDMGRAAFEHMKKKFDPQLFKGQMLRILRSVPARGGQS